jgi:putative serine protease PepD
VTDSPTFTRAERCPRCGQPLVLGVCTLCGPERATLPPPAVSSSSPSLLSDGPPAARPSVEPAQPRPPLDRTQTFLAVGVALLVLSLLASLFLILKVTSLDSKLKEERTARTDAEARIVTLEGSVKGVQGDQLSLHSELDAQAAADPTAISSRVQPSVYTVETPGGSLGSAWVASSDHVTANFVTNYHVIADAWESGNTTVSVYQDQGRVLEGTILQARPDVDLALINVTADIPALTQSNETPRSGEAVLVVGSPFGLGGSVTTGAVSALREINGLNYIQFSAPTSPGNSGGPLVNPLGEVIGITELKAVAFGAEGISIAIPVNQVCIQLEVC